ncbi:MAG: M48 family metallopeptidase [Clostridia bacterium]|nr:M48 family metallopeptidase [Clostridia bacterium]
MTHNYILNRSRRKTISLTVKPDCTVEVNAPLKASTKQIDEFVSKKSSWIEKQLVYIKNTNEKRQKFVIEYGTQVYFFGKRVPIVADNIRKAMLTENSVLMPQGLDSEEIKQKLIMFYKDTAREYISNQLPYYCALTGLNYSKFTISSAKTNWGSCTSDRLHFSWHLIMSEKEVIDYVIIHELTHTKHHNHSSAFWNEVSKYCPEWKKLRTRLRFYSEVLSQEGWC